MVVIIVLISAAIFAVMVWPTIVLNSSSLERMSSLAEKIGVKVDWKNADVSADSLSLFDKRINLHFEDICVETDDGKTKACFKEASLRFRYAYSWFIPKLKEIGPANFIGGDVYYETGAKKSGGQNKNREIALPSLILPSYVRNLNFFSLSVEIDNFKYVQEGEVTSGKITARGETDKNNLIKNVYVDAEVNRSGSTQIKGDVKVSSESGFRKDDFSLSGKIHSVSSAGNSELEVEGNKKGSETLEFSSHLKHSKGTFSLGGNLDGTLQKDLVKGSASFAIRDPSSQIHEININSCQLSSRLKSRASNDAALSLSCSADMRVKKLDLPDQFDPVYEPPDRLLLNINSELATFFIPDAEHKTSGTVNLQLMTSKSRLVETSGTMGIHLNGVFADFPKKMQMSSEMNLDFHIHEFSKLIKIVESRVAPVPAPFNALDGELILSLNGNIPSLQNLSDFPVQLVTRLQAPDEKFDIDAKGQIRFLMNNLNILRADVDLDVDLTDVQIPLPNLSLANLPRLTPDSRIYLTPEAREESKKPGLINYHLDLSTPQMTPLRIISNLAKAPVPIHLDLTNNNGKYSGVIKIDSFPISLFRRKGSIDRFKLDLEDPLRNSIVSAKMTINVTEYQISVLMEGSVERPRIWFESNPPLSETDIISVLLYGDTFDDLDSEKAASAGSMNAAMANKAMALVTFFVFASTPIQTIGYNPETGALMAKIRLGEKMSLTIGTTKEHEQSVGLRRRLGKGFIISTSVNKDPERATTKGAAFLEWHKRY